MFSSIFYVFYFILPATFGFVSRFSAENQSLTERDDIHGSDDSSRSSNNYLRTPPHRSHIMAIARDMPDEQKVFQSIMRGYEKSVRPVMNASEVMQIRFGLLLNQIVNLDTRREVLITNIYLGLTWKDCSLRWDSRRFGGVNSIHLPSKRIWLPDTFVYNSADNKSAGFLEGPYVVVENNGLVIWPLPMKLATSCFIDITYFPFDDQKCILHFGSWVYSTESVKYLLENQQVDLTTFRKNSEWHLMKIIMEQGSGSFFKQLFPFENHSTIKVTLTMRRQTLYYTHNVIVPCVMLSVLTVMMFWLPSTSGEKITLGLSIFLCYSMFMLLVAEEMPTTSNSVPLIGMYLTSVMTMTSLSVVMAVLIVNTYHRGEKSARPPAFIRGKFLRILSKLLCVQLYFGVDENVDDSVEKKGNHMHPAENKVDNVNEEDINANETQKNYENLAYERGEDATEHKDTLSYPSNISYENRFGHDGSSSSENVVTSGPLTSPNTNKINGDKEAFTIVVGNNYDASSISSDSKQVWVRRKSWEGGWVSSSSHEEAIELQEIKRRDTNDTMISCENGNYSKNESSNLCGDNTDISDDDDDYVYRQSPWLRRKFQHKKPNNLPTIDSLALMRASLIRRKRLSTQIFEEDCIRDCTKNYPPLLSSENYLRLDEEDRLQIKSYALPSKMKFELAGMPADQELQTYTIDDIGLSH